MNKIRRAKQFVTKHRTPIAFSIGALAGAAIVHRTYSRSLLIFADSAQLQALIDNPKSGIVWSNVPFAPEIGLTHVDNPTRF